MAKSVLELQNAFQLTLKKLLSPICNIPPL